MELQEDKKRKLDEVEVSEAAPPSKDDLRMLLEPLTKEQLVDLLIEAGSKNSGVAEEIRDVASKDPAHRKLFVRGLAWETDTDSLREAFKQFGEVEEGAVIIDKATKKSRGFGFITFKHMDSCYRALKEPSKRIDGRMTVCNLASAGSQAASAAQADVALRKIYVGGLGYETSSETLLNFFSQFGEIEEGAIAYDKNTNKSRGFAFVTFKTVEGAKKACQDGSHTIEGRQVVVKIAAEGARERATQLGGGGQGMSQAPMSMAGGQQAYSAQPGYPGLASPMSSYRTPQVATPPLAQAIPYPSSLGAYGVAGAQQSYAAIPGTQQYGNGSQMSSQYAMISPSGQYAQGTYSSYAPGQLGGGTGLTGNTNLNQGSMPYYNGM